MVDALVAWFSELTARARSAEPSARGLHAAPKVKLLPDANVQSIPSDVVGSNGAGVEPTEKVGDTAFGNANT